MRSDALAVSTIGAQLPTPGIGTRRQWVDAGASARMFQDGRLRRVSRGLYAAADDAKIEIDRFAALLPEGAVIGGWAAAQLFGFRDAGPTMATMVEQPVLAYLSRSDHRHPTGFDVRRSDLLDGESVVEYGVRVTSPERTAYDLARFAGGIRSATGFLDSALWAAAGSPVAGSSLQEMVEAHPHGKGNPLFRSAMMLATGRARSFAESSLRVRWVREVGVPADQILTNAVLVTGTASYELDLVDLTAGLVIEYDGEHHSGSEQRSRDARKDAVISDAGLSRTRCNAPELASNSARFTQWAQHRRAAAIAIGAPAHVTRLVAEGRLAEHPLKLF